MNSFTQKRLRVTLIMSGADSVFPGTNSNTLVIDRLRVKTRVTQVTRLATQAEVQIFGMRPADMDALTVAWSEPPNVRENFVIVEADNGTGYVQVFKGTILEAQPNYNESPNVSFGLLATTGYFQKINPAPPSSYPAEADIDTIAAGFAEQMGFAFENGGATGTLAEGAYFWGTLWDQLAQACQATNTDWYIFGDKLLILPHATARDELPAVVLSAETGLVGYPMYERAGLLVNALFNPAFTCGTPIEIRSIVPNASGRWFPYAMTHNLEALQPRGHWLTSMQCLRVLPGAA